MVQFFLMTNKIYNKIDNLIIIINNPYICKQHMNSLQTESIKSLLDNYSWDKPSLQSIKEKINDMMLDIETNELIDFYFSQDSSNEFREQLNSCVFKTSANKEDYHKLIVNYGKIKYEISCMKTPRFDIHYSLDISDDVITKGFRFDHAADRSFKDPFYMNNIESSYILFQRMFGMEYNEIDDGNVFPDDIIKFGLFLWKYFTKRYFDKFLNGNELIKIVRYPKRYLNPKLDKTTTDFTNYFENI